MTYTTISADTRNSIWLLYSRQVLYISLNVIKCFARSRNATAVLATSQLQTPHHRPAPSSSSSSDFRPGRSLPLDPVQSLCVQTVVAGVSAVRQPPTHVHVRSGRIRACMRGQRSSGYWRPTDFHYFPSLSCDTSSPISPAASLSAEIRDPGSHVLTPRNTPP